MPIGHVPVGAVAPQAQKEPAGQGLAEEDVAPPVATVMEPVRLPTPHAGVTVRLLREG